MLAPDTALRRPLPGLVQTRHHPANERTHPVNQLYATLKTYYPLAETLLDGQMNEPVAAEFLARWPDLATSEQATLPTFLTFFL